MFKNILIPMDGSPPSQKAVVQAVALAKSVGAKVTGFFAAPPATPIVYRNNLPVGYATPEEHAKMIEKTRPSISISSSARRRRRVYPASLSTSPVTIRPKRSLTLRRRKNAMSS